MTAVPRPSATRALVSFRARSCAVAVFVVAVAGACASTGGNVPLDRLPVSEYVGHYTSDAAGEHWFRGCGAVPGDSAWWVTWTERSVAQADSARASGRLLSTGTSFVRVRAVVSTSGRVGPRGKGQPVLVVRELLEARPAGANDCAGR